MATDEYPLPNWLTFHAIVGPPRGHCLSRPVSLEMLSRLCPRHWGQSFVESPRAAATPTTKPNTTAAIPKRFNMTTSSEGENLAYFDGRMPPTPPAPREPLQRRSPLTTILPPHPKEPMRRKHSAFVPLLSLLTTTLTGD